ncbi:MAG: type II secretion system F family protein [Phycisphaerales bacterium]|nr:type II secretion system F family protein [Phycisphaerales bacterium]
MSAAPTNRAFFFQAMKPTGSKTLGVRSAADESALAEELRREQLLLLSAYRLPAFVTTGGERLGLRDEAALNDQLHILLSRGVPLTEALEVASSVVSARAAAKIGRMRESVAAGAGFADACERVGGFDPVAVAVYRSAERTGDLAGAAERLARAARRRLAISGKAITVLIYPAVIATVGFLLFMVLVFFLLPTLAAQIRALSRENSLPWFSEMVFSFGEFCGAHRTALMIAMGVAVVAAFVLRAPIIAGVRSLLIRTPAAKDLILYSEISRFFSVMAAMTKSGVTLAEALATSVGVISQPRLRSQLDTLRQNLVDGGLLRVLLDRVDALPLATRRLLMAADRAGDLDSAFDSLASTTADEVDKRAARLLGLIEPAALIALFLVLGPVIVAIAVPLITRATSAG